MEDAPVGPVEPDEEGGAEPSDGPTAGAPFAQPAAADALAAVEALLREKPQQFGFFQAVRLLERLHPEARPVGEFADPASEVAQFGVHASLAFPPGEIHELDTDRDGPASMVVNFMGTVGPQGVLPHDYTRTVALRRREKDGAMGDFLDLFHHRILSLFYQAWRRYRFELDWEDRHRAEAPPEDRFTRHLLDIVGIDPGTWSGAGGLDADTLAGYASFFGQQQRSAVALEQLVGDHFGVLAEVEQFVGGWYRLGASDHCVVGEESMSSVLGCGAVVGDEVWDQQAKVRIRLGPMNRERFDDFLPSGEAHERLRALVRLFSHDQYEVEVQLVLERDAVPGFVLGEEDRSQPLGWATWVRTREFDRHADDTILQL